MAAEEKKKELWTKMSRMCRVKADRHLQMIGSKLYARELMKQCAMKKKTQYKCKRRLMQNYNIQFKS
jgi:hypothetical protein